MFGPTKHKYLGKIISLRTPISARESVRELNKEFLGASTNAKRLRIARAIQLAANRAKASSGNMHLSVRERAEYREIYKIYSDTAKRAFRMYKKAK